MDAEWQRCEENDARLACDDLILQNDCCQWITPEWRLTGMS